MIGDDVRPVSILINTGVLTCLRSRYVLYHQGVLTVVDDRVLGPEPVTDLPVDVDRVPVVHPLD